MSPTRMTRNAPMPSRNGAKISCTMYRSAMPVRMRRLRVARIPGEAGLKFCGSYLPPVGGNMHAAAQSDPAAGAAGIVAASVERGDSQGVSGGHGSQVWGWGVSPIDGNWHLRLHRSN